MQGSTGGPARGKLAAGDVFCISCGGVIARDDRYCTECGTDQPVDGEASSRGGGDPEILPLGQEYCTDCGAVVESGTPFCGNCGAEQVEDDPVEIQPSDWLVGIGPGLTPQNLYAVFFFYLFLFPIGVPTLAYGYLSGKRGWSKRKAGAVAFMVGLAIFTLVFS